MSIEKKAFKGAAWLAIFKLLSQVFSWIITILVARILSPGDYGLMEMATIITGYAAIFSELGLGSAIIQRQDVTQEELSSVFWFSLAFSSCLSLLCFVVAYPTSYIFREPRVIPLTQAVSVLFILSGLQIVPLTLMKKELEFKKTGFIEMVGIFISCIGMYIIAVAGGGAWTLLGGHLIREFTKLVMVYSITKWFPRMHFNFNQVKNYISFGAMVALGSSLFYVYDKSDRFFAGRKWDAQALGYYSFALQLAKIPTEKIVVLINQVSYPVFAKYQFEKKKFNSFYLNIVKMTSFLVIPIFVGGFLTGEDIIKILFNEKWFPMIDLFRYLCLSQIITSLVAINNFVHTAQGRPQWSLVFNIVLAVIMPISFYFAVRYGMNAILIPWFTTYTIICIFWIYITIRTLNIKLFEYLGTIMNPAIASLLMSAVVMLAGFLPFPSGPGIFGSIIELGIKISAAVICYLFYMWFFDRSIFADMNRLRKS